MKKWLLVFGILFFVACGGDTTASTPVETGLGFEVAGDFAASASASISHLVRMVTTATCDDLLDSETDELRPDLQDGLDCDGDFGVAAHITPSQYAIAFKRVKLVSADAGGTDIDLISDTGTLANSEVVSFTEADSSESVITIDPDDLTAGNYSGIETEMYYFQMTFPVGGVEENVRIYMSDDHFDAEGNLGHHQGDIVLIDDEGSEMGWIDDLWSRDSLTSERGQPQNGGGGEDLETGHERGFFGNADLWNAAAFNQGATQDIYVTTFPFAETLEVPDPSTIDDLTTVTLTFSVADTFWYEDFEPFDTFNGGDGGDGVVATGGWAPLEPTATVTVE